MPIPTGTGALMKKHSQLSGDHQSSALPKDQLSGCLRSKDRCPEKPGCSSLWWSTAGAGPTAVQGLAFCVEKTSNTENTSSIPGTWTECHYKMNTQRYLHVFRVASLGPGVCHHICLASRSTRSRNLPPLTGGFCTQKSWSPGAAVPKSH